MKLHTEEQVKGMIEKSRIAGLTAEYLILSNQSIELPSDEEIGVIALKIADTLKDKLTSKEEAFYLAGFQTCAKWMREQIQKQIQKQLLTDIMQADEKDGLYDDDDKSK